MGIVAASITAPRGIMTTRQAASSCACCRWARSASEAVGSVSPCHMRRALTDGRAGSGIGGGCSGGRSLIVIVFLSLAIGMGGQVGESWLRPYSAHGLSWDCRNTSTLLTSNLQFLIPLLSSASRLLLL